MKFTINIISDEGIFVERIDKSTLQAAKNFIKNHDPSPYKVKYPDCNNVEYQVITNRIFSSMVHQEYK